MGGDGLTDSADNCIFAANSNQRDTNADGYGNLCDPDFDGNVDFADLMIMKVEFFGVVSVIRCRNPILLHDSGAGHQRQVAQSSRQIRTMFKIANRAGARTGVSSLCLICELNHGNFLQESLSCASLVGQTPTSQ